MSFYHLVLVTAVYPFLFLAAVVLIVRALSGQR